MISLLLAVIYLAFISLGLPDSLLGAAWSVIYQDLGVPISWSGAVFMVISFCTVISSLMSDRITARFGTGRVTAVSVAITALALFGFSVSHEYWMLCLFGIPYGLGAGSIDAALNNYVAIHFAARHMSWLHCMWGVGTMIGPYIMSLTLSAGHRWNDGYLRISVMQAVFAVLMFAALPLWKKHGELTRAKTDTVDAAAGGSIASPADDGRKREHIPLKTAVRLRGVKFVMLSFFAYCAIEQTLNLWASSYLVQVRGLDEVTAAALASLFFIGITAGRAISGFITFRLDDRQMVLLGEVIILAGILLILLPIGMLPAILPANLTVYVGIIAIGLGCAPIYPSLIHATPARFGEENSQAVIGIQMASAYVGTSFMPPIFGLIAKLTGLSLMPFWLLALLLVLFIAHEKLSAGC